MRKMVIIVAIIGCILGYGYWHSATHASFHIQLFITDDSGGKHSPVSKAELFLLNSEGRVLAHGINDAQYNFVHLIHPKVGGCHDIEKSAPFSKKGRLSWQECFEHLSTWIPTWISDVRQASLKTANCLWRNIPVTVSKGSSDWMLWWVPHPHIGGKPYSYYSLSVTLEPNDCLRQKRLQ